MDFKEVKIENSKIDIKKKLEESIIKKIFYNIKLIFKKENLQKYGPLFLLIIATILYILSLEGCTMLEYECVASLNLPFFFKLIAYLIICCFLTSIIFFLGIKKVISKYYIYSTILIFFILLLKIMVIIIDFSLF